MALGGVVAVAEQFGDQGRRRSRNEVLQGGVSRPKTSPEKMSYDPPAPLSGRQVLKSRGQQQYSMTGAGGRADGRQYLPDSSDENGGLVNG